MGIGIFEGREGVKEAMEERKEGDGRKVEEDKDREEEEEEEEEEEVEGRQI